MSVAHRCGRVFDNLEKRFEAAQALSDWHRTCDSKSGHVGLSQDALNQAPKTPAAIGARLTTIMGTVQDGEKLRFVTEQRAWKVDNPETLNGHEGHYVHAKA